MQTFTKLTVTSNNIGDEGARRLAQALENNTVRQLVFLSTTYPSSSFNIDTHYPPSCLEQSWCSRGKTSSLSIAEKDGKTNCLLIDCIFTIIIQYRHLPRSIFTGTISVLKGHDIWLKHCRTTR
jgi:hypothetical protein